jgi:hypothetical protein
VNGWFLPEDERPSTAGNVVVPHLHGADYFARLLQAVEATRAGDWIFFTDWRGDADERLTEEGPTVNTREGPDQEGCEEDGGQENR